MFLYLALRIFALFAPNAVFGGTSPDPPIPCTDTARMEQPNARGDNRRSPIGRWNRLDEVYAGCATARGEHACELDES